MRAQLYKVRDTKSGVTIGASGGSVTEALTHVIRAEAYKAQEGVHERVYDVTALTPTSGLGLYRVKAIRDTDWRGNVGYKVEVEEEL